MILLLDAKGGSGSSKTLQEIRGDKLGVREKLRAGDLDSSLIDTSDSMPWVPDTHKYLQIIISILAMDILTF